jgi:hypothetical protein
MAPQENLLLDETRDCHSASQSCSQLGKISYPALQTMYSPYPTAASPFLVLDPTRFSFSEEGIDESTARLIAQTPTDLVKEVQKHPETWFLAIVSTVRESTKAPINGYGYELSGVPRYDPTSSESEDWSSHISF